MKSLPLSQERKIQPIQSLSNNLHCVLFQKQLTTIFLGLVRDIHIVWQYGLWSFQTGGTKLERFLPKNQHGQRKFLNFENWTIEEPQQLAKIRAFKVDYFILPLFLVPKLRSVAQNEWKKHPYIYFSTFGSKINEFERKKSEKNEKIPKT